MSNFTNKIKSLGGVEFLDNQNSDLFKNENLSLIEKMLGVAPQTDIIEFISEFGNSRFIEDVYAKTINKSNFLQSGNIEIGTIFGWGESNKSIISIVKQYHNEDQVNSKFFPVFEGYPGDIIYCSLEEISLGKIFYWYHESDIDEDDVCIANSLSDFINTLFIQKEELQTDPLTDSELNQINEKRKKVGLPPIDKFKNVL